jgi:hypothetical protein
MTLAPGAARFAPPQKEELLPMIREHWLKYRPRAVASLQNSNYLDQAIQTAADLTLEALSQLINHHSLDPWEAWVTVREQWALLPAEESDETELLQDNNQLLLREDLVEEA